MREEYPTLFIPCINNSTKLQINAINDERLNKQLENFKINNEDKEKILSLMKSNQMEEKEIKAKIIELCPEMKEIIDYWDETNISNLNLSSVGIIIGALTASKTTSLNYDLHIWIE